MVVVSHPVTAAGVALALVSIQRVLRGEISLVFFSSRRRHTRCSRDWSSDVCSSDLFTISVIALLTLSFSPCGDCWTLLPSRRDKLSADSSDYTWPVRLLQLYLVEIYFFSGYAKLMGVGWKWASASNIRNWMLWCTEEEQIRVFHTLGTWIADRPFACWSVGIGTLLFELGLITALFWKWPRRVLVPLVAVFHLGILLAMNLVFFKVPQLLVFFEWDRGVAWFKLQPKPDSNPTAPGVA